MVDRRSERDSGIRKYLVKSLLGTYAQGSHFKLTFVIEINNRILFSWQKWDRTSPASGAQLHVGRMGYGWVW
jgi:hypothetical protein